MHGGLWIGLWLLTVSFRRPVHHLCWDKPDPFVDKIGWWLGAAQWLGSPQSWDHNGVNSRATADTQGRCLHRIPDCTKTDDMHLGSPGDIGRAEVTVLVSQPPLQPSRRRRQRHGLSSPLHGETATELVGSDMDAGGRKIDQSLWRIIREG